MVNNPPKSKCSKREEEIRHAFMDTYKGNPIHENEQISNIPLFINRQTLSRMLFFNEIYQKIVNIPGVIMEFGVYWGRDLAVLQNLRSIYEPFNFTRKIIGFDTFEGLKGFNSKKDGTKGYDGVYSTNPKHEEYLEQVLQYHENESPLSHIKKFELIKGDVCETLPKYLNSHPETIISLAYFDLDLYEPTKDCLETIKKHLIKGSIICFDELNYEFFPGETLAVKDIIGLNNLKLQRVPYDPVPCYFIFGDFN